MEELMSRAQDSRLLTCADAKFSAGPWSIGETFDSFGTQVTRIVDRNGSVVAEVFGVFGEFAGVGDPLANARLIRNGPRLFSMMLEFEAITEAAMTDAAQASDKMGHDVWANLNRKCKDMIQAVTGVDYDETQTRERLI